MSLEGFDFLRVLSAAGLSFLAMTALIAGTFIGIFTRPSQRTNAIIMAFGTGALIQALAIDLAFHGANRLIEKLAFSGMEAWLMVSMGFMLGGFAYYVTNKALEKKGAAIRHPALAKFYFLQKKRHEQSLVLEQLSNVELLRLLPPQDMELVLGSVEPVAFNKDEFIFKKGDEADGLYLIIAGHVNVLDQVDPSKNIMATLSTGDSFGEMALLTGDLRYARVLATTPVSLLKINKSKFNSLIRYRPFCVKPLNSSTRNAL